MVRVILVRHGETDWNHFRRVQGGGSNIPLNEKGRKQAENLARRLGTEPIQAIYSSPLQRAVVTAETIARPHNLKIRIEPSFREIEVGELEGVLAATLGKHLDQLLVSGDSLPRLPGGESLTDVRERAWGSLSRLAGNHSDGVFVVVSHYFVILSLVCTALGLPLSQIGRFRMEPASLSTIVFDQDITRLVQFNDHCHCLNGNG